MNHFVMICILSNLTKISPARLALGWSPLRSFFETYTNGTTPATGNWKPGDEANAAGYDHHIQWLKKHQENPIIMRPFYRGRF